MCGIQDYPPGAINVSQDNTYFLEDALLDCPLFASDLVSLE